jgi:predicted MPP superfamily phosphohydrolase
MTVLNLLANDEIERRLEARLGRVHAKQRLGIEKDHEAQAFGQGLTFLHLENVPFSDAFIEGILRICGMYRLGRANADRVELRVNEVRASSLPQAFNGFTILHLSDLHVDMSARAMENVTHLLKGLHYDICVFTGDYRGKTFGPFEACLGGISNLREVMLADSYGVLGNHDTIRMVPDLERMGIRMLLNEYATIERDGTRIYLVGIDDAHFYRVDNIEKAATGVPEDAFSILLSHTPEIYRQAAHAGFKLLLSGHTHGGQICLPGEFQSCLKRRCLGPWAGAHGNTAKWRDTRLRARVHQLFPSGLIARPKLRCIGCAATCEGPLLGLAISRANFPVALVHRPRLRDGPNLSQVDRQDARPLIVPVATPSSRGSGSRGPG